MSVHVEEDAVRASACVSEEPTPGSRWTLQAWMLRAGSEPCLRTSLRPGQPHSQQQLPRGPGRGPEGGLYE